MENKHVGGLVVGISFVMAIIVFIFNSAMKTIVKQSCTEGPTCPMYETIKTQTLLSLSITGIVLIVGLIIMFAKPKERIIIKKQREKIKKLDLSKLEKDEKKVIELLISEGKAMFQSDLMEKIGKGKVGMTRLLDKLESKQFIERKRRGNNNIVVLKD